MLAPFLKKILMLYLFEVKKSKKYLVKPFLNKILGVGNFLSTKYCKKLGFLNLTEVSTMQLFQKTTLEAIITKDTTNFKKSVIFRTVSENITNLVLSCCFRGIAHKKKSRKGLKSKKSDSFS
jgi:ribosomal protein S13